MKFTGDRRWSFPLTLVCTALCLLPLQAYSQAKGPALVIGNVNYPNGVLTNATADAQDVAADLKDLGFQVVLEQNVSLRELNSAIDSFRSSATSSAGIAVFYYSGHGIQVNGNNYLIPIDAVISQPTDVDRAAVSLQKVFDALGGRTGPNIIILDACRTNPFATDAGGWVLGLAAPTNPSPNSVIAYSTSPLSVASDGAGVHSPYTRALLRYMRLPGQTLPELFSNIRSDVEANTDGIQVPSENTSIAPNVFFRDPIYIKVQFTSADDDAMILMNGDVVSDWNQDGTAMKRIRLARTSNNFVVKVYNQRSYTGGIQGLGGHLPEGWSYVLKIQGDDGAEILPLSGRENVPADNGPHHGKLFTVATFTLEFDEKTAAIHLVKVDPAVWAH
jgi:hypothetical protein